jgi:hypothetical protein
MFFYTVYQYQIFKANLLQVLQRCREMRYVLSYKINLLRLSQLREVCLNNFLCLLISFLYHFVMVFTWLRFNTLLGHIFLLLLESLRVFKVQSIVSIIVGYFHHQSLVIGEKVNVDSCKFMIFIILRHRVIIFVVWMMLITIFLCCHFHRILLTL